MPKKNNAKEREKEKERRFVFRTKFHSAHILSSDVLPANENAEMHKITPFTCSFCVVVKLGLSY